MRRLRWFLVMPTVLVVTAAAIAFAPTRALGNPYCGTEDSIFWTATDGAHNWLGGKYGDRALSTLEDRDLASGCSAVFSTVSTTHVDETIDQADMVETGWVEWDVCDGCAHLFSFFIEAEINYNFIDNTPYSDSFPCTYNPGDKAIFIVGRKTTSYDWQAKINCQDGSGVHVLGSMDNTGHNTGFPGVEVSRHGGSGSGMADLQENLYWRDSSGTFTLYPNFKCLRDFANSGTNNWNGEHHAGSNSDFDTYTDTTNSCPGL